LNKWAGLVFRRQEKKLNAPERQKAAYLSISGLLYLEKNIFNIGTFAINLKGVSSFS